MNVFDIIIIGFGKGGGTLVTEFTKHGQKMAVIERSDRMCGDTCINIGCIPARTLIHQAKVASSMKELTFLGKREFHRNIVSVKDSVTGALRNKNYHNLTNNPHVTIYTGFSSFVSSDTVSVRIVTEELLLAAKQIITNTGAETVIPSIDGIADDPFVYTSTSIMELTDLPCHFAVAGGGYIGLEFASMYASSGPQVTVPRSYPELIARGDRDITASVKGALGKKSIVFRVNVKVQSVNHTSEEAIAAFTDLQTNEAFGLEADAVLLVIGRGPNTQGLYLEAVGVEVDARGAIIIGEYLKTTNPAIRAMGDVKGGLQSTYISLDDYRIIRGDLFRGTGQKTDDHSPVSYSVFINPPLAHVGLNEEEAHKQNLDIIMKKLPVMVIPRTKALGETDGLLKAIIDKKTGLILGYILFTPGSSEMINTVTLAIKTEQDCTFLRDFIFTHPSMSEALNDLFIQQHFSIYS